MNVANNPTAGKSVSQNFTPMYLILKVVFWASVLASFPSVTGGSSLARRNPKTSERPAPYHSSGGPWQPWDQKAAASDHLISPSLSHPLNRGKHGGDAAGWEASGARGRRIQKRPVPCSSLRRPEYPHSFPISHRPSILSQ